MKKGNSSMKKIVLLLCLCATLSYAGEDGKGESKKKHHRVLSSKNADENVSEEIRALKKELERLKAQSQKTDRNGVRIDKRKEEIEALEAELKKVKEQLETLTNQTISQRIQQWFPYLGVTGVLALVGYYAYHYYEDKKEANKKTKAKKLDNPNEEIVI